MAILTKILKRKYIVIKIKITFYKRSRSKKKSTTLSHKQNDWLEPMQRMDKSRTKHWTKLLLIHDLFAKKVCAKEIFGSNLFLAKN